MDLVAAKGFAQGLATMTATRLEIVREDGSVAVAVDPEIPPSLRHVPKLVEEPADGEPVYSCQLCGRVGSSDTMHDEECPKRSGVLRKITLIHDDKPPQG